MNTRRFGRTGLEVSPLCFGGNVFGWTIDEPTSFAVLDAFVARGGNFIDTADVYSRWAPGHQGGESEAILGNWMHARGNRHSTIIASKIGMEMGSGPNMRGLSRQRIVRGVEDSLQRLQTDYIDIYQSHADDPHTPQDETLRAFDDLIRQGKVRYIGASNFSAWRLTASLWASERGGYAQYASVQPRYNLIDREEYERELEPMVVQYGIGVICYSSLASGFLSGKYRREGTLPESKRAGGIQQRYMNDRGFAVLDKVLRVAETTGATPGQVAIAWLLQRPSITAPIVSATSVAQVEELCGAVNVQLAAEDL